MGLFESILLGSYMYTTAVFVWFQRKYEQLYHNHLAHTEQALNETRAKVGLPPVRLAGDDE